MPISWVRKTTFFSTRPAVLRADAEKLTIESGGEIVFQTAAADVTLGREAEYTFIAGSDHAMKVILTRFNLPHKLGLVLSLPLAVAAGAAAMDGGVGLVGVPVALAAGAVALGFRPWLVRRESTHPNAPRLAAWRDEVSYAEPGAEPPRVHEIRPRNKNAGGTTLAVVMGFFAGVIAAFPLRFGLQVLAESQGSTPTLIVPRRWESGSRSPSWPRSCCRSPSSSSTTDGWAI